MASSSNIPPIITWDYQFAPNAQKARNYLYATQSPFKICEQPFVMPRPILDDLGITYRRVPVVSIGRDVFPDNTTLIDAMQDLLKKEGKGRALKEAWYDRAFEQWGYVSYLFDAGVFEAITIPASARTAPWVHRDTVQRSSSHRRQLETICPIHDA